MYLYLALLQLSDGVCYGTISVNVTRYHSQKMPWVFHQAQDAMGISPNTKYKPISRHSEKCLNLVFLINTNLCKKILETKTAQNLSLFVIWWCSGKCPVNKSPAARSFGQENQGSESLSAIRSIWWMIYVDRLLEKAYSLKWLFRVFLCFFNVNMTVCIHMYSAYVNT